MISIFFRLDMVEIRGEGGGEGQKVAIILTPEMKAGINLIISSL
jgi:hypothetical protein